MTQLSLRDRCVVNTDFGDDIFVGIKSEDGEMKVHFPLGFDISDDEKLLRKEILLLISTLRRAKKDQESNTPQHKENYIQSEFPVYSYLTIIRNYLERGLYRDVITKNRKAKQGKICWPKTIKKIKPMIQGSEVYYLDFITKCKKRNEESLLVLIHKYCIYESFIKIGWLFTSFVPSKPTMKYNKKLFLFTIKKYLDNTFNEKNRTILKAMANIIKCGDSGFKEGEYESGTRDFEDVWEDLIDRVYNNVPDKTQYYPSATWVIDGKDWQNEKSKLRQDSIIHNDDVLYILDAKYYKYGQTKINSHLPPTSDINKQITYGESIEQNYPDLSTIYNAFLMPFNSTANNTDHIVSVGEACGDWNDKTKSYQHIQAILVDVKNLMLIAAGQKDNDTNKLLECIEHSFELNKKYWETKQ